MTTLVNKKQGEYLLIINDKEYKLKANFRNIALFEENMKIGYFEIAQKFSDGNIRVTDLVKLIYAFDTERDKPGHTYDEIGEAVFEMGAAEVVNEIVGFLEVLYSVDNQPKAQGSNKKK